MTKRLAFTVISILVLGAVGQPLRAQAPPNVRYIHDEAGNLIGSVDANGNAKMYRFDAAGRLVSIDQLSAAGDVDIFFVEPQRASGVRPGTSVTVYGTGFSDVTGGNQVTFNGVAAVVEASTSMTIQARVPAGARTGPVQVTVQDVGMATSRTDFKINNCITPPANLVSWWTGDGDFGDVIGHNDAIRQGTTFGAGWDAFAFSFGGPDTSPFTLGLEFVAELDRQEISEALRDQFRSRGRALIPPVRVAIEQAGSRWRIFDANTSFYLLNENQRLTVYPDTFLIVPHRANLTPRTSDFTIAFWIKTTSADFNRALLNKRESCGTNGFWSIRLSANGNIEADVGRPGETYGMIGATPVNDGNWHHVALLRQGATARLYVDGQARTVDTKEVINIDSAGPLLFGRDLCYKAPSLFYRGLLDEIQWFLRALTADEVQNLFANGICKP